MSRCASSQSGDVVELRTSRQLCSGQPCLTGSAKKTKVLESYNIPKKMLDLLAAENFSGSGSAGLNDLPVIVPQVTCTVAPGVLTLIKLIGLLSAAYSHTSPQRDTVGRPQFSLSSSDHRLHLVYQNILAMTPAGSRLAQESSLVLRLSCTIENVALLATSSSQILAGERGVGLHGFSGSLCDNQNHGP
ncbi:hypothetical protein RRG08_049576 [Elysia crispata]|uniref:Uncharacterized protein n=1 Tax=Elysia crispata TaxID=231223 RepID=A0AAE1E4Q6_9GAST|nr:hypothetical protein RRG08_049576 [Elysia crispata]